MKWRYGGVRHGTSAGKRRDIAFGVLDLVENSILQRCIIVIGITGHTHLVRGRRHVIDVSW